MGDAKQVEFSLKVMINKEKTNKVLFAEVDSPFADILISFLTLPLGRIMKVLEKHYGDEAPTIGSLTTLYSSLANLDRVHFVTEGAKQTLLNPTSSFEDEYKGLKLDFTDSPPAEYFYCTKCGKDRYRSVSMYYDKVSTCFFCNGMMSKEVVQKRPEAGAISDGIFTKPEASFVISDDLHIFQNETPLLEIVSFLGVTDTDKAEAITVEFGFNEIMKLLKASLTSPTPLSDVILNKTTQMNSQNVECQLKEDGNPCSRIFILKVIMQKSTGKLLYAQAEEEFVEFLFSFLFIPLGVVGHLLAGKTCIEAINNLYKSTTDLIDECLKSLFTKNRLIKPNIPHGCVSENYILPLTQEGLPVDYAIALSWFSSDKFPKGQGSYLQRPQTYQVKDDLTVEPYCFVSILSSLKEQKILLSDVEVVELKIGLKEALSILKRSLTSTSTLSDALLNHKSTK